MGIAELQSLSMAIYHYILFILLVSVRCSVIIGGFGAPLDLNSTEVKSIYDFIVFQIPALAGWNITEVRSQVVSGRNYQFSLSHGKDTALVKVYQPLDRSLKITLYSLNNQENTIPELKAYEINSNLVEILPSTLVPEQLPQSNTSIIAQSNITEVNLLGYIDLKPFSLLVSKSNDSDKVWGYVCSQYPSLSSYKVVQIWKSQLLGSVFLIVSQSSSKEEMIVFKVVITLANATSVEILQTNSASGFTMKEISIFRDKCYEQRPELSEFLISSISNGENNSTLKFIFTQEDYYYIAYGFYERGERKIKFEQ